MYYTINVEDSKNVIIINNTFLGGGGVFIVYRNTTGKDIFLKVIGNRLRKDKNLGCSGIRAYGGVLIADNTLWGCGIEVSNFPEKPSNIVINNKIYWIKRDPINGNIVSLWFQRAGISFRGYNNIIKNNLLLENGYAIDTDWNHTLYNIVVNNTIKYSTRAAFLIRYINYSDLTKEELMQAIRPLVENNILIDNRKEFVFAGISRVIPPIDKSNEKEWGWKIFLFSILGLLVIIMLFALFYVRFRKR